MVENNFVNDRVSDGYAQRFHLCVWYNNSNRNMLAIMNEIDSLPIQNVSLFTQGNYADNGEIGIKYFHPYLFLARNV